MIKPRSLATRFGRSRPSRSIANRRDHLRSPWPAGDGGRRGGKRETDSRRRFPNAVKIAELAVEKQAQTLLLPMSARRQLNDLPDDMWAKIGIEFYRDATDAVFKALVD